MGAAAAGRAMTPSGVFTPEPYRNREEKRKADRAAALAAAVAKTARSNPIIQASQAGGVTDDERRMWEERTVRAQRAMDAQREGRRTRRARADRPPPPASRLYAPDMSCDAARDARLPAGAVRCLQIIQALQKGQQPRPTKTWLAAQLAVSTRTVQRYLADLRQYGYIATNLIANAAGWVIGQVVRVTNAVLPFFRRFSDKKPRKLGETIMSPIQIPTVSESTSSMRIRAAPT